jgi:hypothetical protein
MLVAGALATGISQPPPYGAAPASNQDNIQSSHGNKSSHGNICAESSDSVNLRNNLALLIDKCQRPAFS